jgi:YVTN family beta-propeller protein
MRRKVISSASLLSVVLSTILSLTAIYSGVVIAKADSVIATVPVGGEPSNLAFDSTNGDVYVTSVGGNTVSVISGQTNTVVGNPIPVGLGPVGIAFDSANGNLYVTNIGAFLMQGTVAVISGQTNTVIGSPIPVGRGPIGIAFDSANGDLYVANNGLRDNTVSVISGKTNTVIGSPISVGNTPTAIAFDSANGNLYVTNVNDNTVSVISGQTNTVIGSPIPVGRSPEGIAFDSANGDLYVANTSDNTVSVISGQTNTVIGSPIPVGKGPIGIAFDSTNGNLYVTNFSDGTVSVISASNIVVGSPIPVGVQPVAIAFDSANGNLYVANRGSNTLSVISAIVTPTQSIQQLIQLKHSMHLDPVTDQTLDIRLNIALQFAQNNIKSGTCIQLTVFIKQVQGSNGHMTSAQATQLTQGAQNIQTVLGCTVPSSGNGIGALSASTSPPSLNLTRNQQEPQTTASSPSLSQPQSQSPYPYTNQYRYPPQYPYLSQTPQSQSTQNQQLRPVANAGISQTVNENARVTLDGRASYSPTGGVVVAYQWTQLATTGVPVVLTGANAATPTFTAPIVPSDTVLAFSLRVLDNHGSISTNPSVVYVSVKHNPNNIGTTGGNTPGTTVIQPQQQQQPIVPNSNAISSHSQLQSPIIIMPSHPTVK